MSRCIHARHTGKWSYWLVVACLFSQYINVLCVVLCVNVCVCPPSLLLSHWYISVDNYRWWAGDQLQVWEPPQASPSLAPPALPCSVRHVWQRLLSLSLQLSSGVRQVTAGVPASPSMALLFLGVWDVCLGGGGGGGRLCTRITH